VEDSFHAIVECTKAKALRFEMRKHWDLPREEDMVKTCEDWLLILLDKTKKDMHQAIMMLLWRCWHLRNNVIHDKGKATIKQSVIFLLNYANSLDTNPCASSKNMPLDPKGKKPVGNYQTDTSNEKNKR
jgi:hypothetical protein